ncbi:GNAT family N-acetyltransferase [Microvirga sp. P5_D2]
MINLRPARADDYTFALNLYLETIKPYASEWFSWVPEKEEAQFSDLWRPDDTRVIVLDGNDVGWVEIRQTGDEIFLKQLSVVPGYQGQGIGTHVTVLHGSDRARIVKASDWKFDSWVLAWCDL